MPFASNLDPIAELIDSLETDGKPPFRWMVKWGVHAAEPVAAAWQFARTPIAMLRLLERAAHPSLEQVRAIVRAPALFEATDLDAVRCAAIRRAVPVPPSLRELMSFGRDALRCLSFGSSAA